MVTRTRLQRAADQKVKALVKKTLRQFCVCVAIFMGAVILFVALNPHGTPGPGELSSSLLTVLAPNHLFLPVKEVPNAPKHQ